MGLDGQGQPMDENLRAALKLKVINYLQLLNTDADWNSLWAGEVDLHFFRAPEQFSLVLLS